MVTEAIKRKALKMILNQAINLNNGSVVRAINIGQKYLIKDDDICKKAEQIKKMFEGGGHPSVQMAKDTFQNLSKASRNKIIENFFINAAILGTEKRKKVKDEFGFEPPWFLVISPTAQCNLNCIGCYASEYQKDEGLSFEEVDRILDEAKDLGMYFVTISGGEPFAWPYLLDIFEKHSDMAFMIYTNGTLINKDVAKRLSELGNAAPAISIEGFEKETNTRRGKGTYEKIFEAMDNLKEAGVLFGFSTTPTKNNSEVLMSDEFIDKMLEKGASFGWYFQYVPIGRKPDTDLMSTPEQRNTLRIRINEIRDSKPIFIGDFWNDGPLIGGCIAGARPNGYFHINSQGDVEPCVFLQFSVDNIKDKKLVDVIQSPFFKAIQKAQPYCSNKNLLTPCALIDNPQILRGLVKKYNAKPSYNGSYDVVSDKKICRALDQYSKEFKKLTDQIWEEDLSKEYKTWKDLRYGKKSKIKKVKTKSNKNKNIK
jgi:MoaA/NifB/PqqE/SkfB family radical SAM enzyme